MQFAIQIIKQGGHRELLADDKGVKIFTTRDDAERMTHRLAAADDSGHLYEVVEQPN